LADCDGIVVCPICQARLDEQPGAIRCEKGHTFDRAREGYFDLLPTGHGRSKRRGDSQAMVRARRRFLASGHFAVLAQAIVGRATRRVSDTRADFCAVEVGCGEGYYIGSLAAALESEYPKTRACLVGFDLSKEALRLAARRYPAVRFFVNDVWHRLSVRSGSVDVLMNVFAPRNATEFRRVIAPNGLLIVVVPGEDHLRELRERLPMLGIAENKRDAVLAQLSPDFELLDEVSLMATPRMQPNEIGDLLAMTPSVHHLDDASILEAQRWGPQPVSVSFQLLCFQST
jgi:23S rRNA (guanine745-N1)-methyltransferase